MDDYTIRVDAGDLADIIADRQAARADLETCIRDATEAQAQFQQELDNAHKIYRSLRQHVCEALQLNVGVGHLSDDELVDWVRIARTEAGDITADPQDKAVTQLVRDQLLTPEVAEQLRQPVSGKIPLTDPWTPVPADEGVPPINLEVDVTYLRQFQRMAAEQQAEQATWEAEQLQKAIPYAMMVERDERPDDNPALPVDDGPPTENMPAVEQPPTAPDVFAIGRVFTRGDSFPAGVEGWRGITTRSGDIWELLKFVEGMAVFYCGPLDLTRTWDELLHMHGTAWELVMVDQARAFNWIETWRALAKQPSVAEQALTDDEAARDE
jgi:hypothetical protein